MAQLFRAVGIHIIMATQTVKANIVTTEVKNAMPAALAFACKNATASIMIVGDGSAVGLHPVGRCIMDWGGQQKELQSPLINDKMIAQIIEGARDGQWEEQELSRHDVTDLDIFRASLEAFEGRLSVDPLFNHFRQNQRPIPRGELLNIITSYYDKEVVVDGILFKVMRGDNHHPNRMVAVEEEPELEG
jgi:DNA segregation ATPase FtsK/SpoIIIE-like protein